MYKTRYIFGQMVRYNNELRKVIGIRFTTGGVLYKLSGVYEWVNEGEIKQ